MMFYILISIIAGVTVVVARIINSNLAKIIGIFQGTFFNYVTGLFLSSIFLLVSRETVYRVNVKNPSVPLWAYLGGIVGVAAVALSSYITPKISSFYLTLLIFIGQLFTGIVIDYLALDKLSAGKIIGGFFVVMGLAYNLLLDKKIAESASDC